MHLSNYQSSESIRFLGLVLLHMIIIYSIVNKHLRIFSLGENIQIKGKGYTNVGMK